MRWRNTPRETRYLSLDVAAWLVVRYDDMAAIEARLERGGRVWELAGLYSSLTLAMTWQLGNARILAIGRRVEAALTHLELSDLELSDHERGLLHMTLVCGSLGGRRLDWLESSSIVAPDLIDPAPHPVDHAHAVLMASWGLALADTDRAVTMSSEAAQQAADAGAHRLAAMCHGYCVSHLPVGGRLEEALALVPGVQDALAASSDGFDQADASFSAVLGALFVLT
jgi:hypothetical protein